VAWPEPASRPTRLWEGFAVYREPRVIALVFLGFSSGLPLGLTGQTLAVWLSEEGLSLTAIGLFALVGLPYVLKFLWAPALDAIRVPWLGRRFGRRRGWLLLTQGALLLAVLGLGLTDPKESLALTAALALVVAFCSASQDIAVDAFRVESLEPSQYGAGMATYTLGYRVAMLVATFVAFELASLFQAAGAAGSTGWSLTYAVMAALVVIGAVTVLASREPAEPVAPAVTAPAGAAPVRALGRNRTAVVGPFSDFLKREDWLLILLFVVLFKFADAFAGIMTAPFVLDLGFDKTDYGRIVKVFGLIATLAGGFAGGAVFRRFGAIPSLWLAALVQIASNLMFVLQAGAGADHGLLVATIGIENLAGGFGSVIFVAYLSALCTNRAYTATQYALLSALAAVGRTVLSASAGWFAAELGWVSFFLMTMVAGVPGLVLLWWIARAQALPTVVQR